jgi:ribosomal protein L37AE/L43A
MPLATCPSCSRPALRQRPKLDDHKCNACGQVFTEGELLVAKQVPKRASLKRCRSCHRRSLRERERTNDYRCSACGSIFSKSEMGERELEPEEPVQEDRCPKCSKRALAPRARTHDFRCSACSSTFAQEEVRDHLRGEYEDRLASLLARFVGDVLPPTPVKEEPPFVGPADSGTVTILLVVLALVGGVYFAVVRWGLGFGIGAAVGVGFAVAFYVLARVIYNLSAFLRRQRELDAAERKHALEVEDLEAWKAEEPLLARLRSTIQDAIEAKETASVFFFTRQKPEVRELLKEAVSTHASDADRLLHEKLQREVISRMPPEEGSPYRAGVGAP